ncbi:MAG TPA: hypothetical protein VEH27_12405, partial [Methylomirabilota bacterium]|nr:hypothetical protein [Methylomirabilota bacterium]
MKARRICISERRNASGTISYKVEGRDEKNRRRRRFFSSKEDALAYRRSLLKALKTNGRLTLALSSKEILDAQAALQLLKGSGATLVAAVEYYCKHAKPVGGVKSLQEVCDECLAKKERAGKKPKYLKELRSKFRQFCRRFAERPINSLSVAEVDEWLHSNNFSRLTIGNYIRELGVLFSFA